MHMQTWLSRCALSMRVAWLLDRPTPTASASAFSHCLCKGYRQGSHNFLTIMLFICQFIYILGKPLWRKIKTNAHTSRLPQWSLLSRLAHTVNISPLPGGMKSGYRGSLTYRWCSKCALFFITHDVTSMEREFLEVATGTFCLQLRWAGFVGDEPLRAAGFVAAPTHHWKITRYTVGAVIITSY